MRYRFYVNTLENFFLLFPLEKFEPAYRKLASFRLLPENEVKDLRNFKRNLKDHLKIPGKKFWGILKNRFTGNRLENAL